ncbi:UNVERIFIED_CONTAM: hypothetical protein HDU68_008482 [Siphonaria sp. JEL0065]|nr:hypothetical protein HDU68_008482 [Siphonaria sp. JEL0065]
MQVKEEEKDRDLSLSKIPSIVLGIVTTLGKLEAKRIERGISLDEGHQEGAQRKDIAADKVIAKKYKAYAKMKTEGGGKEDPEDQPVGKRASEATLRNSIKIPGHCEIYVSRKEGKSHKTTSRAAEDNSGSGEAEELFKTIPSTNTEPRSNQSRFANYTQQPQLSPHDDLDEEDRAAMEFFNNTYVEGNGKFAISKEQLYASTTTASIQQNSNRSFSIPEYSRSTSSAGVLPNNFKMRKSTIATGPISTDERVHSEAQLNREYQRDSFYRDNEADSSCTLRTFTPSPSSDSYQQLQQQHSPFTSPRSSVIAQNTATSTSANPELQNFMYRRQQLHEIHNNPSSSSPIPSTPPTTSSTPASRNYTPQPRATSALGAYTTVPTTVATQIRVITPTTATAPPPPQVGYLQQQEQDELEGGFMTRAGKFRKPELDLVIPKPPVVVSLDDFGSSDEQDDDENQSATVFGVSRLGGVKAIRGVQLVGNQQQQRVCVQEEHFKSGPMKAKKGNGFFPVEGFVEDAEKEVYDIELFGNGNTSNKTLVIQEPKVVVAKQEEKEDAVAVEDEEEKSLFVKADVKQDEDAIAVVEQPKDAIPLVVVPALAPTFLTNPKLFSRIPQDFLLKCRVQRKKNLLDKTHPTFYLYNETDDKFLLAARKRKKSATVNYLISTSQDDLSKDSTHYIAKLKANFQRTNFILHDARFYNKNSNGKGLKEIACVSYVRPSKTVLPRELNVAIPAIAIEENSDSATKDIMADIKSQNKDKLLFLKNKPPRWNETTQSHCLNFGGRVTQPSIKNFQLVMEGTETIILQFGRCGPDVFSLDVRYPMTPIEAFAVALTTFDACDSA